MTVEQLTKQIWQSEAGLTFEQARKIAERIFSIETRERKEIRVVRAEETR